MAVQWGDELGLSVPTLLWDFECQLRLTQKLRMLHFSSDTV